MILATLIFFILAFTITSITYYNYGMNKCIEGFKKGIETLIVSLPTIVAAILLANSLGLIIPKEYIVSLIGSDSGLKGIFIASIAGTLLAVGPNSVFPIIGAIYSLGAGQGAIIALITSWSLFSLDQYPFSLGFLGPKFVLRYHLITLPVPFLAGYLAYLILR